VLGVAADGQQLIRLFAKVKPENASAEKVADLVAQFGSDAAVWAAVVQKYGEAVVAEYKPLPADNRAPAGREQVAALEAKLAAAEQAAAAATALGEQLKQHAAAEAERAAAAEEKLASVEAELARSTLVSSSGGSSDAPPVGSAPAVQALRSEVAALQAQLADAVAARAGLLARAEALRASATDAEELQRQAVARKAELERSTVALRATQSQPLSPSTKRGVQEDLQALEARLPTLDAAVASRGEQASLQLRLATEAAAAAAAALPRPGWRQT
jgi:DNA repair exonuclease SbcCD ATPase subunit